MQDEIKWCVYHHQKNTTWKLSNCGKSSKQNTVSSTTKCMENKEGEEGDSCDLKNWDTCHLTAMCRPNGILIYQLQIYTCIWGKWGKLNTDVLLWCGFMILFKRLDTHWSIYRWNDRMSRLAFKLCSRMEWWSKTGKIKSTEAG